MMVFLYLVIGIGILLLQLLQKKHRILSLLSVLHSALTVAITGILILWPDLRDQSTFFLVDNLSLFVMLITGVIFSGASVFAVGYIDGLVRSGDLDRRSLRVFYLGYSLLLLVATMALFSPNVALFWIFAELTTVLSALLIAILALRATIDASLKYIFICSSSMLFSFIGIIFLFEAVRNATGTGSLDWSVILQEAGGCDSGMIWIAFVFFFIGFAAKSGIVPFHTWLPEAHAKAPSAVSAVLSGAILNIGMYAILRITGIVHQTGAADKASLLMLVFALVTISIACFSMLHQKKLKSLIAFSSIENMGFILLAAAIGTPISLFWALFHMLGHSTIKAWLFFSAGILHRQYKIPTKTGEDEISDLFRLQPVAALTLMIGFAALIGMPGFPLFLSKFGILIALGDISIWITGFVLLLFAVAAVALMRYYLSIMALESPPGEGPKPYNPPSWMTAPILFLLLLSLGAGVIMTPGEEAFLISAVFDIGIGVNI